MAVGAAVLLGLVGVGCGDDGDAGSDAVAVTDGTVYSYTIPAGAGERIDEGEDLEILPAELEVEVGDSIEIVNEDERGHNVGAWFVGAGETLRQDFAAAGEFEGVCTVHPSGEFVLRVVEDQG